MEAATPPLVLRPYQNQLDNNPGVEENQVAQRPGLSFIAKSLIAFVVAGVAKAYLIAASTQPQTCRRFFFVSKACSNKPRQTEESVLVYASIMIGTVFGVLIHFARRQ